MPHDPALTLDWNAPPAAPASVRLAKPLSIWQAVFSFPVMLCLSLTVLTVLTVRNRFNDPDLWWHLKIGQTIWDTHSIPNADLFSFTAANHAWIAHEWLSETIIYGAYRAGGYAGLMIWLCALPSLLFVLVYVLCSMYSGNAKISLVGGMLAWFFGTIGLSIRPHLLGYTCLVLEVLVLHLARTRGRRWFWALPPLFALWVNCHGSFVLGLLLLGLLFVCSWFEFRAGSLVCSRWSADGRRLLVITSVLSAGALFVNPIGWRLVLYPFDLIFKQTQNLSSVSEWQPLDLLDPRAAVLFAVATFFFLMVLVRRAELRLEELAMLALGFGLAIRHNRMMFVFGILAAPIVCRLLANAWDKYDPARDLRLANAVMMAAAVWIIVAVFPGADQIQQNIAKSSPVEAVDYIRQAGLTGRMLNEYEFGGYLIWALPEQKVFIDGRCDLFDWTGVLTEYGRWATLSEDPKLLLDKYHIDFCLFRKTAPQARVLQNLPGWRRLYQDDLASIFVRSGS
ncbi:MAG: hypothetical protein DMF60_20570 [Acidobacteria bacterium]|nr:MAG: hypothetical protein DMF60_20570 [Acidobacteriota bacterium]